MQIPLELENALQTGTATLFLGAGITYNTTGSLDNRVLTGDGLARAVAERFRLGLTGQLDLAQVAQVAEARHGRAALVSFLKETLAPLEPDDDLVWLVTRTWKAIYTTNYDRIVQRCFEIYGNATQTPVTIASTADITPIDWRYDVPVYHLHGSLFTGDRPFALITVADYAQFRQHRGMLFELLKYSYATSPILYVGYSAKDPNWNTTLGDLRAEFAPNRPPISYRVIPAPDELEAEALAQIGVVTLLGTVSSLTATLKEHYGDLRVDPRSVSDLEGQVPPGLRELFRENPAATLRLCTNWEYVNEADFAMSANTQSVLHGDIPNWGFLGQREEFVRDIEDDVFETIVDFATAPGTSVRSLAILGPAGFGVSTTLRTMAVRVARERLGTVLMLNEVGDLLEGDTDFASNWLTNPLFLFIDRASGRGAAIPQVVGRLRAMEANAMVVVGDRLNEWRQRAVRLSPREYLVQALSDGEIDGLLDYLARHDALGVLAHLPRAAQAEAIRIRHGKQLLVAMKEATENRDFDTIIEDEYLSLPSERSRKVYASVAALHRNRMSARDTLVAAISDLTVAELYDALSYELEGVVVVEDDPRTTSSLLRTRHPVIADVVWGTALRRGDRSSLVVRIIEHLNLHYPTDREMFENLYRSDDAVDQIADPSERRTFFDKAVAKDPTSPYILQHYARMLLRSGETERALAKIDDALVLRANGRSLHHTRGVILSAMAEAGTDDVIARRRMRQAEESFRRVLGLDASDPYGYEGLSRLYLEWAQRRGSDEESGEFLAMAEEVLSDGMIAAGDKAQLWMVSAEIARFVGDRPEIVNSLRAALSGSDDNKVARYLLARELAEQGRDDAVIEVVEPVLGRLEGRDYRLALVYAISCVRTQRTWSEALAPLRLIGQAGLKDARFAATLGGILFMASSLDEAERAFDLERQRGYRAEEYEAALFEPEPGGSPLRLRGRVRDLRPGYAFLRVPTLPADVFLPRLRVPGAQLHIGTEIEFSPAFSARGPLAGRVSFPSPSVEGSGLAPLEIPD